GLLAQYIGALTRLNAKSRVRLPARKRGQRDRPAVVQALTGQVAGEAFHVEGNRCGGLRHDPVRCIYRELTRWPPSTARQEPVMAAPASLASSSMGPSRSVRARNLRLGMRASSF